MARKDRSSSTKRWPNTCIERTSRRLCAHRLGLSTSDLEFVEWLVRNSVPFVLVFTKTDKVTPTTVQTNIDAFTDRISGWCENLPEIFTCSATARHGRSELLGVIEAAIATDEDEAPVDAERAPQGAVIPFEALPPLAGGLTAGHARGRRPNAARPW